MEGNTWEDGRGTYGRIWKGNIWEDMEENTWEDMEEKTWEDMEERDGRSAGWRTVHSPAVGKWYQPPYGFGGAAGGPGGGGGPNMSAIGRTNGMKPTCRAEAASEAAEQRHWLLKPDSPPQAPQIAQSWAADWWAKVRSIQLSQRQV